LTWEAGEPILHPEDGAEWERGGLYKPCLLRDNGTFYLFYNAKDRTNSSWHEQTGVATSTDLKNWKRYEGNPIIRNGGSGSFDEHFASDPCVLRNGPEWAFFYFGLDRNGVARDLVATGPDLLHATKHSAPLIDVGPRGSYDDRYAHKPSIVSSDGDLYHFYCAVGGNPQVRGIAVARSRPW
jgi:beta-xylosidase